MSTVQQHYDELLAPIYLWMSGGRDAAFTAGAADVSALVPGRGTAVDLGAGFGMHAIPLAHGGYDVVAIDTSVHLLRELQTSSAGLSIRAVQANLLDFRRHVQTPARLIVCLGDTLTHLATTSEVEQLCEDAAASLEPGGRLLFTFRDYTHPLSGDARFIPVRSDATRIHTCFLETLPEQMLVHDILHERGDTGWQMRLSSYPKLRLAPQTVAAVLRDAGLEPHTAAGPRGMVCVTATRP